MQYRNATHVLPDELLKEIQKYANGEAIYIPKLQEKKKWGEGSGARRYYEERNLQGGIVERLCRLAFSFLTS